MFSLSFSSSLVFFLLVVDPRALHVPPHAFPTRRSSDLRLRGLWVDPRDAEMPLAVWAEEFLSLCRRLSPTTQETYRRDLERYVLPRFGTYRLGQLPADETENWLNDEIAAVIAPSSVHRHYRTLGRMMQVAVEKQQIPSNHRESWKPPPHGRE